MFVFGEVNPCNSRHCLPPGDTRNATGLTLTLFVLRVFADHPDYSFSFDNLALIANLFYGCPDFHGQASCLQPRTFAIDAKIWSMGPTPSTRRSRPFF